MFNFTSQLDDLFVAVYAHASAHMKDEGVAFAILLVLLLVVTSLQKRVFERLSVFQYKHQKYSSFLVGLIFPLVYFLAVKYSAGYLKGPVSQTIFTSVAYIYLGYYFIKYLLEPLRIGHIPWNLLSYALLILASVFLLLINLNEVVFKSPDIADALSLAYKISLILLVYIFVLSAVKVLSRLVPEDWQLAKSIASNLMSFISVLYLIVATLWLFRIIGFASSVFVGGVVIFITIIFYVVLKTYVKGYLVIKSDSDPNVSEGVVKSVQTFLNLLLIYVLYLTFIEFYNLDFFASHLKEFFIIKTGVIKVSFFSVISGLFVFMFLLSIVGIFKYLVYIYNLHKGNELQAGSIRSLIGNLGLLIVIMVSLSQFGLTWAALLPVAGALGLGIGIGLQDIMKNYISGIILLFSNRLKVGDVIEIEGNAGRAIGNTLDKIYGNVISIDAFSTVVSTTDRIEVVVPNSQFIEQQMVNYSLSDSTIRIRIPFGVSYSSDPNQVKDILLSVASENDQIIMNPAPSVWFTEYADSAIIFYLLCWVNIRHIWKINPVISDIYFRAWYEFEQAGIVIPFPQQDVWFKNNLKIEIDKEIEKPGSGHDDGVEGK